MGVQKVPPTKKGHTVEEVSSFQNKEVEKGRSQHQTQYLELNFSTNVTRINDKHKYISSFFLSHNPTYSYKFPRKSSQHEKKGGGMDRAEIMSERLSSMRFISFQINLISAIPLENKNYRISTFGVHNTIL